MVEDQPELFGQERKPETAPSAKAEKPKRKTAAKKTAKKPKGKTKRAKAKKIVASPEPVTKEQIDVKAVQLAPGVHEKVSPDVYHAQAAISRSDLVNPGNRDTPWTPATFKHYKDHPTEAKPSTPDQVIGDAFHTKILEPSLFQTRYAISPFKNFRTKASQMWADEQHASKLQILTPKNVEKIDMMEQIAREHPHFATVFRSSKFMKEVTLIARDPATGLLLRARYDMIPGGTAIPDLKSTRDASPEGFGKQVWDKGYGFQAAFYLKVYNLVFPEKQKSEFIFFAFEKEPPYLCEFYSTPQALIEYCDAIIKARLYQIAHCAKTNKWPGYRDEIPKLGHEDEFTLPYYGVREIDSFMKRGE